MKASSKKSRKNSRFDHLYDDFQCTNVVDIEESDHFTCDTLSKDDEDYCDGPCHRCLKIKATVRNVNVVRLTEEMVNPSLDPIFQYSVNRILTYSGARDAINWIVNLCDGYYGEEIYSVKLDRDVADAVHGRLLRLAKSKNPVHEALINEYGYLLEVLKPINKWEIRSVNFEDIMFPGMEHYVARLDQHAIDDYTRHWPSEWPCGIAVKKTDHVYRLIDGQHRVTAQNRRQQQFQRTRQPIKLIVGIV